MQQYFQETNFYCFLAIHKSFPAICFCVNGGFYSTTCVCYLLKQFLLMVSGIFQKRYGTLKNTSVSLNTFYTCNQVVVISKFMNVSFARLLHMSLWLNQVRWPHAWFLELVHQWCVCVYAPEAINDQCTGSNSLRHINKTPKSLSDEDTF